MPLTNCELQVEQEKSKLENYTKRSLGTFKDKYMAVLQTLKEEKEDLQQKMRAQLEKSERNQVCTAYAFAASLELIM